MPISIPKPLQADLKGRIYMKKFIAPDLDILRFVIEDIIATSGETEGIRDIADVNEGLGWN